MAQTSGSERVLPDDVPKRTRARRAQQGELSSARKVRQNTEPEAPVRSQQKTKRKRKPFFITGGFDLPFFILVMALLTIGLAMLFSASHAYAYYYENGDSLFYIKKQLIFAVIGVVAMIAVSKVDYHKLRLFAYPLFIVSTFLLVLVLFVPPVMKDYKRWLRIPGIGMTFQPSDIAKFAIVLLFAHLIAVNYDKMKTFKYGILPFALILIPTCLLIYKEPHLSGTLLVLGIGAVMMFVGGARSGWFIAVAVGVGILLTMIFLFPDLLSHASTRIASWLDKDSDPLGARWQTNQGLYAIGSGGLLGVGFGNSKQKFLYVSEPQNDFIFSIVCEELGFVGAMIIILLFILLLYRGFVIAMRAPDKFGSMLAIGLVAQVGLQTALNIAVVTDTIPNTGISLPFFSYGGTALVMLLFQMGVVLGISRASNVLKT